jgi:hypothetical protein
MSYSRDEVKAVTDKVLNMAKADAVEVEFVARDCHVKVIVTTDHGTIRVKRPFKIIGDRSVNSNLRYKQGKNLGYEGDKIMNVQRPEKLFLPKLNVSSSYVFAIEDQFFAYPNNYNYYVNFYKDTFQHGGVSMEEIIIPLIFLTSKNAS